MAGTNILLSHLLPGNAVELGRLVLSVHYPEQDFYQSPPDSTALDPTNILTQHLHDFQQTLEQTASTGFKAYLSTLLSGGRSTSTGTKISLATASCTTRQLLNSSAHLDRLCATRPARFWLERALRRAQDVFLVTGIKTVVDAAVTDEASRGAELQGKVQAPLSMAAAGAGVPLPIDGMLDVGVEASRARTEANSASFTAPGEQIFAVQYRKLRFARFKRKEVDDARLEEGNRWKMYLGGRGEEEDEDEQIVGVEVGEELEESDLGRAQYEDVEVGGEKFMYPSA
ncbi:hypothetical protein DBV05_g11365 [Lasiodiplodia theobromae]|uniref:Uncharacterized protein n=1 Tax=Lasiodiplodia theobromae TaxID=45133 RepID=A0A5N5CXA6_9PEZI|nr:hypothetical protein DBV05_g11365 [Lasiodiplodia theobromae]